MEHGFDYKLGESLVKKMFSFCAHVPDKDLKGAPRRGILKRISGMQTHQ